MTRAIRALSIALAVLFAVGAPAAWAQDAAATTPTTGSAHAKLGALRVNQLGLFFEEAPGDVRQRLSGNRRRHRDVDGIGGAGKLVRRLARALSPDSDLVRIRHDVPPPRRFGAAQAIMR